MTVVDANSGSDVGSDPPPGAAADMQINLLGSVEAMTDHGPVSLGGPKPRALLAMLALGAGSTVSVDHLIDGLWGDDPPATANKLVQLYVSQLRKAIAAAGEDGVIATRRSGYELCLGRDHVDAARFERLLAQGAAREALDLWRGPALSDVAKEPFAAPEIRRLDELHTAALEVAIDQDLAAGRHREVLPELEALLAREPLRERLHAQRLLALYRCGRQAAALEAYREARAALVEEIGVEPGPELRRLHDAILQQDPSLDAVTTDRGAVGRTAAAGAPAAIEEHVADARCVPAPPNRTIGRDDELDAIAGRLRTGSVRLLTLTGPGGVGKTRLALEVARELEPEFADGACFVSLAPLRRPHDVPAAIVRALGVMVLPGESPSQAGERFLAAKHLLLVVDNFEHVLVAAPVLGRMLEACPALTILATSREPLSLHAEERYLVPPLAVPQAETLDDPQALADVGAVVLFCERARAHDPDFDLAGADPAVVAEICRRLDGLPLAIELAAARCGLLSAGEIALRLKAALGALGDGARDAPARQQTLRATIDWSYDLLGDVEQACFARFAVFAGGATIEAAETVTCADLDVLGHLVTKSLLVRRHDDHAPTRLRMLETIRAYAMERFASTTDDHDVRERHYRVYRALAERHGDEHVLWAAGGQEHLATLDADVENLHAALGWALGDADAERALALVAALGRYWLTRDRYADAIEWIDQALSLTGADAQPALRVRALLTKTRCLWALGRGAERAAVLAEAEAVARGLGDPVLLARALRSRADHELDAERLDVADAFAGEAMHWAGAAGDDWEIAEASYAKAIAAPSLAELGKRVDVAASLLSDAGNVHELANLLTDAAYAALCLGGARDAADFAARATPSVRALDDRGVRMINSGNVGLAALLTGKTDDASDAFREELVLCRETVVRPHAFEGLRGLAAVAAVHGEDRRAAALVGAADAHRYDQPEDPVEATLEAVFFEPARTRCGSHAWDAAAREGGALGFEAAIAYALAEQPVDARTTGGS